MERTLKSKRKLRSMMKVKTVFTLLIFKKAGSTITFLVGPIYLNMYQCNCQIRRIISVPAVNLIRPFKTPTTMIPAAKSYLEATVFVPYCTQH